MVIGEDDELTAYKSFHFGDPLLKFEASALLGVVGPHQSVLMM